MNRSPVFDLDSIRRARLVRVAVLYGSASFVILQLCDIFVSHLGLPSWVFPSALVLLIAGLPLVLATALVYGRSRAGDVPARPVPRLLSRLTWRRTLLGAAAAFAALFVLVGGYAFSRTSGYGPFATLVGIGVLAEQEVLVLAEFDVRGTDADIGRTVTEALRVDLSASPSIELLEGELVGEALRRMRRSPGERLDASLARELAIREGLKAVVAGEVATAGRGYILVGRVISASDGRTLLAVRETADSDAALIPAIDRLSRTMRERIGEPLRSLAARQPLVRTTTSSLEALQLFVRANDLARADPARALPLLEQAVALDSAFVAAWYRLAIALIQTGAPPSVSRAALLRGGAHLERLTGMDRMLYQGVYQSLVLGDDEAQLRTFEAMAEVYPANPAALANLGAALLDVGDAARAAATVEPVLASDPPSLVAHVNYARAMIRLGRPDSAIAVLTRRSPTIRDHPFTAQWVLRAAGAARDYDQVRALAQEMLDRATSANARLLAAGALAAVAAQRGREAEVALLFDAVERVGREFEMLAPGSEVDNLLFWRAARLALRQGDRQALREHLARSAVPEPRDSADALDRPFVTLAQAHAMAGDVRGARAQLALARRWWPAEVLRAARAEISVAEALIALEEGRVDEAEAALLEKRPAGCPACLLPLVARAREERGELPRALELWELYDSRSRFENAVYYDGLWVPELYEARARLMLQLGDRAGAARQLRLALAAFRDADPVHAGRIARWTSELRRLE